MIEEGKNYVCRNGKCTGPLVEAKYNAALLYSQVLHTFYLRAGKGAVEGGHRDDPFDITEIVENAALHAECDRLTAMLGQSDHPDDTEVNAFAMAMKAKLKTSREKGRSGWQSATPEYLTTLLLQHVEKGDVVDVANFCMMLHNRGQSGILSHAWAAEVEGKARLKVLSAEEVTEPGWYWHKWPLQKEWQIVKVHHPEQAAGQFVGPLLAPEV